jgi:hypothetical protein
MSTQTFELPVKYNIDELNGKLNTNQIWLAVGIAAVTSLLGIGIYYVGEYFFPIGDGDNVSFIHALAFIVMFVGFSNIPTTIKAVREDKYEQRRNNYRTFDWLYLKPIVEKYEHYDEIKDMYDFRLLDTGESRFYSRIGRSDIFAIYAITLQGSTMTIERKEKEESALTTG